mmetsp:Transcript_26550/g.68949  ORF Transcript_26550/g.68949 Transcript_26550/m.68949 type:complete len:122 (-) Transcript_26550:16-381(-)
MPKVWSAARMRFASAMAFLDFCSLGPFFFEGIFDVTSAHGCGALRGFVAFGDVTADVYCVCYGYAQLRCLRARGFGVASFSTGGDNLCCGASLRSRFAAALQASKKMRTTRPQLQRCGNGS